MYSPRPSPRPEIPETEDLTSYIDLELRALSRELQVDEKLSFVELHVEPEKPRDGMVVFADGTDWNPGSGRGAYLYYGAAWNFLGGGALTGNLADLDALVLAQGDILYYNGTNLVALSPGTNGHFLKTQGAAANPLWAAVPGGGDLLSTNNLSDVADASVARTNLGLAIGTNVQAFDVTLSALAAYNTNGLLTQTAADTFAGRTLTGTAGEIEVTNGDGVAGNPTVGIPAVLDLGGNTSVEIPNGTGPTVDAAGEVAVDTNTDNSNITHGTLIFHDGTSVRYNVSVATLPSTNGHVLTYNGTNKRFEFASSSASISYAVQADMEAASSTAVAVNPAVQHFHPGHPKCWAYVTVSGGTPTLQTSYNITSITDTATGRLTVTIATDFSTANWASFASYENTAAGAVMTTSDVGEVGIAAGSKAVGSVILECHEPSIGVSGDLVDPTAWNFIGMGDL